MADHVIAAENTIVHDDVLGIDRQIIAGTAIPPDLIGAYEAKVGSKTAAVPQGEDARDELHAKPPADTKPVRKAKA